MAVLTQEKKHYARVPCLNSGLILSVMVFAGKDLNGGNFRARRFFGGSGRFYLWFVGKRFVFLGGFFVVVVGILLLSATKWLAKREKVIGSLVW